MRVATMTSARQRPRIAALLLVLATTLAVAAFLVLSAMGSATSGDSPYTVPAVVDSNPDPNVVETTLTSKEATVDIGGVSARAQAFNGTLPGRRSG